jgi:hypothetical protein
VKYLDFMSLLAGDPAQIAFLSTFQFDPDFFERRLLRCEALAKARRIVVFMDARQWSELLRRDVPARGLNRRYLVVPVQRATGVFHPKLHLLLRESGVRVICGSNNLTRSGCSSNLELLNAVQCDFDGEHQEEMDVAREAFAFFESAAKNADDGIARIVAEWIDEAAATSAWLRESVDEQREQTLRLVHTYGGSMWDRLVQHLDGDTPEEFFVVSPFHDVDAALCRRFASHWPHAKIELLVQQGYTNLSVRPLKKLGQVHLSEIRESYRRVHAKLIAWRSGKSVGCLVGSANFTTAAFDGRNVEACLLLSEADDLVDELFDRQLSKRPLAFDDFEPGNEEQPESATMELPGLRINSAILAQTNHLRVHYSHRLEPLPASLRLAIRIPGDRHPRVSLPLPRRADGTETVILSELALADVHGTLLATLVADVGGKLIESFPVWVIQEHQLTYEPWEGSSSSKSKVEETGEGLPEFLDELGKRDGLPAVIEYLRHLNIRFHDGGGSGAGLRKFRIKIRDPFQPDAAPDWLIAEKETEGNCEQAILEFVDRHQKRRLERHASRGNINGMENFLDIFTTLVELMYRYYKRGIVKGGRLVSRFCSLIPLATAGRDIEDDPLDGYLYSIAANLGGDVALLSETCGETNYLAEVRAALLIVQRVRFELDDSKTPIRSRDVLPTTAKAVVEAISECRLKEPGPNDVRRALEGYRMFSEADIAQLIAELPV